jgi:hypothetical protein
VASLQTGVIARVRVSLSQNRGVNRKLLQTAGILWRCAQSRSNIFHA